MKRTTRQEANARMTEIDTAFHEQITAINAHEYEQVSGTCAGDHPEEVRDLLIKAIRQDAARARRQAHSDWMTAVRPWARQIVGANV